MNIYCFSTLSFAKLQFKSVINKAFHKHGVASFTDAWIETLLPRFPIKFLVVASFTDAWIETGNKAFTTSICLVASFTDAWIETGTCKCWDMVKQSHLLQMRGLKLLVRLLNSLLISVASFTDAWIETEGGALSESGLGVASFTDAWIETR